MGTTKQAQEVIFNRKTKKDLIFRCCLVMSMLLRHLFKITSKLYLTLN